MTGASKSRLRIHDYAPQSHLTPESIKRPGESERDMTVSSQGPSLKERQRQERERLILRAAMELLAERGYHEMSLDDIAARVGIAKGTIYLHFARKEDLVLALMEYGMNSFLRTLDEALSGEASPQEKLQAVIEQLVGSLADPNRQLISTVLQNPEMRNRLIERREAMGERWKEPRRRLAAVIDQGKAQGVFDTKLPTPLILNMLMGLLSPHSHLEPGEQGNLSTQEMTALLSRFFFKGIAADAGDASSAAPHPAATRPEPSV